MIVCIGLTPTVQRTMIFDVFRVGEVNRARATYVTASGKGVNVARVITRLGGVARAFQILGGDSGRFVAQTLEREGVAHQTVWAHDDAPTRTCTTLLSAADGATELVEEAQPVDPHDRALLRAAAQSALLEARAVCLSGSLPPGIDASFYAETVAEANRLGIPVVVDTQKAPLLATLAARPFLVKPNREEAAVTLGFALTGDGDRDARTAVDKLVEAGAAWALVSLGRDGSLLGNGQEFWRIVPPEVTAVNPIGSGDSLAAGFLYALTERGMTVPDACVFGTACGAANCLTPTSGVVNPADVERLLADVKLLRA
jgi:tagatose 6-phosphate kinase